MRPKIFLSNRIAHRLLAFLLAAAVVVPNFAFALREEPPAEAKILSGLEETLRVGPDATLKEIRRSVNQLVPNRTLPAAGLEETFSLLPKADVAWVDALRVSAKRAGLEENPISLIATEPAGSAIPATTFSSDGKILVWASGDRLGKFEREIHLLTVATGKTIVAQTGHLGTIRTLGFSPGGRLLASLDFSGNLLLWETQHLLQDVHPGPITKWKVPEPLGAGEDIQTFAFSPDGKTLAAGSTYGRIFLFGLDGIEMREVGRLAVSKNQGVGGWLSGLTFGLDSSSLVVVLENGSVFLGDIRTQKLNLLFRHSRGLYAAALSPDGATLAITDYDWKIYLHDSHTGQLKQMLDGHWDNVRVLAFSPDSRLLVSGGKDGALRVIDVTTSKVIEVLRMSMIPNVGDGFINGVAFSPNGKTLAVASGHVTSGWSVWTWMVGAPVRRPPSLWKETLRHYRSEFNKYPNPRGWDEQVAYLWRELQEISGPDLEANQNAFLGGLVKEPEDRTLAVRVLQRLREEEPLKPFAPSFDALVSSLAAGLEEVIAGEARIIGNTPTSRRLPAWLRNESSTFEWARPWVEIVNSLGGEVYDGIINVTNPDQPALAKSFELVRVLEANGRALVVSTLPAQQAQLARTTALWVQKGVKISPTWEKYFQRKELPTENAQQARAVLKEAQPGDVVFLNDAFITEGTQEDWLTLMREGELFGLRVPTGTDLEAYSEMDLATILAVLKRSGIHFYDLASIRAVDEESQRRLVFYL